jgi:hypothetical protein
LSLLLTSNELYQEDLEQLTEGESFYYFMTIARQGKLTPELFSEMLNDRY